MTMMLVAVLVVVSLVGGSAANSARTTCDHIPANGCTCSQRHNKAFVHCDSLGLTSFPDFQTMANETTDVYLLSLSHNNIEVITHDDLDALCIRTLVMDSNSPGIPDFEAPGAVSSQCLESLDLSSDSLSAVPSALSHFHNLRHLDLSDNDIGRIRSDTFANLMQLNSISLHGNPLRRIHRKAFWELPLYHVSLTLYVERISRTFVEVCSLFQSYLVSLTVTDTTLAIDFKLRQLCPLVNLQELVLANCAVSAAGWDDLALWLSNYEIELLVLDLHNNRIRHLPAASTMNYLKSVERLDLSQNQITSIPSYIFERLPNLGVINLNDNELAAIEEHAFWGPTQPLLIDLSHNRLTGFIRSNLPDELAIQHLTVKLGDNPWHCDCQLRWLVDLVWQQLETGDGPFSLRELEDGSMACANYAITLAAYHTSAAASC